MKKSGIKIWELSLLLALSFSLCWSLCLQSRQSALSDSIIRLHVIAQDDSPYQQQLKLRVRDAVLAELEPIASRADTPARAREDIAAALPLLETAAESASGGQAVRVLFGRETYGTRSSGGYTLPAGSYHSLQVVIGSGAGRNWWGVIFPQLSDFAASDCTDAAKILGSDQLAFISDDSGGVELRFRVLEWLQSIKGR